MEFCVKLKKNRIGSFDWWNRYNYNLFLKFCLFPLLTLYHDASFRSLSRVCFTQVGIGTSQSTNERSYNHVHIIKVLKWRGIEVCLNVKTCSSPTLFLLMACLILTLVKLVYPKQLTVSSAIWPINLLF